jgi:hypothetical protein
MQEPDEIDKFATSHLGTEADLWWKSPLGRYVVKRSLDETEAIRNEFRTVDPLQIKQVQELQSRWKIAEQALIWLNEAIAAGKQAAEMLEIEKER